MQSLVYTAPNEIVFKETEMPVPKPGEALIKVRKAGICGSDSAIVHGLHPRALPPLIPGHEFVGEIAEMPATDPLFDFSVGDRVVVFPLVFCGQCRPCREGFAHVCRNFKLIGIDCNGGFAEYAAISLKYLVKLPGRIDYDKGVLTEPLAVGIHAVDMAKPGGDDLIVVLGAGAIGLLTAYSLCYSGFRKLLISDVNPRRLQRAQKMNLRTVHADLLAEKVNEITKGEGADIVFECAGAPAAALNMTALLRPRGKAVIVSVHKKNPPLNMRSVNFKEIAMVGSRVYTRTDFETAIEALEGLDERAIVSHTISIKDGRQAFALFDNPEEDTCKITISMEN